MEAGAGGDAQNLSGAMFAQQTNEKVAFTVGTTVPIDQFVPFFDKGFDVFEFVMNRLANRQRTITEILRNGIPGQVVFLPSDE